MVFQFEHVSLDIGDHKWDLRDLSLPALKASLAGWQHGLAERGWNSLYFGNHDQPRSLSRYGDDGEHRVASAKTLATVLHLHRGTPYVYQGDEIGMRNAPFTEIEHYRDIEALNAYAAAVEHGNVDLVGLLEALGRRGRDHGRTPVQWDDSPSAGFSAGTPWIAVNPDFNEVNVRAQEDDPHSVLAHYRRLIALRKSEPALTDGRFELLLPDHPAVWAIIRAGREADLLMAANCSGDPVSVELLLDGDWTRAEPVLRSHPLTPERDPVRPVLEPWESVVWRRRH
jgi:oligo-1,6-glucosidase